MNSKKHIQWLSLLIVFLVFFGFGQSAWGATVTSAQTGPWNDVNTWVGGAVPTTGVDDVVIAATHIVTLDINVNPVGVDIIAGGTLVTSTFTLNLDGPLTNAGTLTAEGGTLLISGTTITNTGTITTDIATDLTFDGTGAVTLPATGFTPIGTLTINKTDGATVTLGTSLTIGEGTGTDDITITSGYLNLNGTRNITLADANGEIVETAPYKIINNGAAGAYVVTQNTTSANLILSGIGITSISPAGTYTIYRYPMPASSPITITGVGTALDRVYRVTGVPTAITLQFDNTDVNSLITDLSLYTSTVLAMTSPVTQNNAGKTNRTMGLAAGKSTVAYSSFNTAVTTDNYYTLASEDLPANTKVFTGLNSVNWNDGGNWNPAGVPLATDNVLIPSGKAATADGGTLICNNLTITDATLNVASGQTLDINGNLALNGTSALTAAAADAEVEFSGAAVQTITVAEDSYCEFGDLTIDNAGNGVTTASNITLRDLLTTTNGAFTQTAGTFTFNPLAASALWVVTSGVITLNDVILNIGAGATPATPASNITIKGDFTKIGAGLFTAATPSTVTFTNTNLSGKTLQAAGGATTFFNLTVSSGSKLKTTSDISIAGTGGAALTVASNAEFKADAGTITITGAAASISNSGTLEFNNLNIAATALATTTTSDFTIKGTFTCAAANAQFVASTPSNITFINAVQKAITNSGTDQTDMTFFNLTVAEGSDITTATPITINGDLELKSGSEFTLTAGATYFNGGATQDIIVASNANLEFFNIIVGDVGTTTVSTTANFKINGTVLTINANDAFNATAGTINCTSDLVIISTGNGNLSFFNLLLTSDADVTVDAGDFVDIKGNLIANNTSSFTPASDATTRFNGTGNQIIGGNSTDDPFDFGILIINKGSTPYDDSETVDLEADIQIVASGALTLTEGVLDLNDQIVSVGGTVTRTNGYINGNEGTYQIITGHSTTILLNALFNSTLYNIEIGIADQVDGDLLVNGSLDITAAVALTIPASTTLTVMGDLDNTGAGTIVAGAPATSFLKLSGTGSASDLDDAFLATMPSLIFERGETLTGNLTMVAGNILRINTSTQYLDLSTYTLTLNNTTVLQRLSGGIEADAGVVILGTHASQTTIPANLFKENIVNNMTIAAATTLGGDLTVNGTLTGTFVVTTNNNTLTFGPNSGALPFTDAAHVKGNLQRTVTNTATLFPIGDGTANGYSPITLQFQTAGSSQVVKVSSVKVNPTFGRGGDPTKVVNVLWTITPSGSAPSDNMNIIAAWDSDYDNAGVTFASDKTFLARWNGTSWIDYRGATNVYAVGPPKSLTPSTYDINANSLSGPWAVFSAATNSNEDKDLAISVSRNKLAIKNITPSIVEAGVPFTATVEYQDQYGNGQIAETAITLTFTDVLGSLSAIPNAVIAAGTSSVVVTGFAYATATAGNQFKVTGTGDVQAGISPVINVIGGLPSNQVNTIALTASTTSTTLGFALAGSEYGIIIAKAGSAITSDDFPVDGTTYFASNNFGEGSKIGGAVVVYKGQAPGSAVTISGLAPNTTYYFRGFSYGTATTAGTEKYLTFAAANNPKSVTTSGSANNDDDIDYGTNNTMETAKPIGANSPIKGTIKTAEDVDWFSFTITNSAPNLRARLTLSAALGNYNVELYNVDGRRLRRGTRLSNNIENQVINELTPGTYLVKISGVNGAFDADNNYTLQLTTDGNEIYSVTE